MRRVSGLLAVVVAALWLAACARDPLAIDVLSLAPPVPADRTRVVIYTNHPLDTLARGDVFINRRRLGPVQAYGVLVADVEPGAQVITVNQQLALTSVIPTEPGEMIYVHLTAPLLGQPVGEYVAVRVADDVGQAALRGLRMSAWDY